MSRTAIREGIRRSWGVASAIAARFTGSRGSNHTRDFVSRQAAFLLL